MKIEFKEKQKFTQWWLWLILVGMVIIPIYGLYKQIVMGEPFGDNPMSDLGLIIFFFITFGLMVLFWVMQLKTEIDHSQIRMYFVPFIKKRIEWKDVKHAEVVNYGFVGWGIRVGTKYGTVYNTKGNKGLAIVLKDGKRLLIGTQKGGELNEIVKVAVEQKRS